MIVWQWDVPGRGGPKCAINTFQRHRLRRYNQPPGLADECLTNTSVSSSFLENGLLVRLSHFVHSVASDKPLSPCSLKAENDVGG
jgi:hypothetical protein